MNNLDETMVLLLLKNKMESEYDELVDALYYYMLTYLEGNMMENCMYKDEVENLLGFRDHEKIFDYIINVEVKR